MDNLKCKGGCRVEKSSHTIAMTGATGFVGSNMASRFRDRGWEVVPLGRKDFALSAEEIARSLDEVDAVVNLAGAPVISRWTEEHKKIIYESRVLLTEKLVRACRLMENRPRVFLSASAIGCYAPEGRHTEEDHLLVDDFLGRLVRDWEQQAFRARDRGIRTAVFRFGVVLGRGGGALAKMLTPFRLGLGGTIGSGDQPFSWIHINDLIRVFETAIDDQDYEGVYNMTAPNPTTNRGLTRALGRVLSRPTVLPVPEFVLRLLFGEGARVLTSGQTVIPQRLVNKGYQFEFSTIDEAVADCITPSVT